MLNPASALAGVEPLMLASAAVMTFGAAYVRGLTGFGMAIILVPMLGLIVTPGEAVVLGILLQVLIGPVGIRIIYADAHRQSALTIAAFAVLATPVGIWLLQQATPDVARLLIVLIAIAGTLSAFALGLASWRLFWLSLVLFLPMLAGNWLGAKSFGRVPAHLWRMFVALILGLAAISAVLRLF